MARGPTLRPTPPAGLRPRQDVHGGNHPAGGAGTGGRVREVGGAAHRGVVVAQRGRPQRHLGDRR